jgi:hypothetical protein
MYIVVNVKILRISLVEQNNRECVFVDGKFYTLLDLI